MPAAPTPSASSAGYSGTPLVQKLGVKPGQRVAWLGAPDHFDALLGPLPGGVTVKVCAIDDTWSGLELVVPKAQRT